MNQFVQAAEDVVQELKSEFDSAFELMNDVISDFNKVRDDYQKALEDLIELKAASEFVDEFGYLAEGGTFIVVVD